MSLQRAAAFPGFHIQLAEPWFDACADAEPINAETAVGTYFFDFLIAGVLAPHH